MIPVKSMSFLSLSFCFPVAGPLTVILFLSLFFFLCFRRRRRAQRRLHPNDQRGRKRPCWNGSAGPAATAADAPERANDATCRLAEAAEEAETIPRKTVSLDQRRPVLSPSVFYRRLHRVGFDDFVRKILASLLVV